VVIVVTGGSRYGERCKWSRCLFPGGSRVLPGDTLASSFGKIYALNTCVSATELRGSLRKEDIARSLIHMVSYNLGYIAYLIGSVHRVRRVFFAGKYINDRPLTMQSITEGVNFYARHYAEAWHRAAQPHDRARAQAEPHAENRPAPTALSPPAASATRQHEAQEGHDASTEGSPTMVASQRTHSRCAPACLGLPNDMDLRDASGNSCRSR